MNSDTLTQLVQKGFRVTLGATASLLEALQDPQRRAENLSRAKAEWDQLAQEWEVKGETTEREARSFVDGLFSTSMGSTAPGRSTETEMTIPTTATPAPSSTVQQDLRELTEQLTAIRAELENIRGKNT